MSTKKNLIFGAVLLPVIMSGSRFGSGKFLGNVGNGADCASAASVAPTATKTTTKAAPAAPLKYGVWLSVFGKA